MADGDAQRIRLFTAFNFRVEIRISGRQVCQAEFADCDGLEMTMQPKTIREGGANARPIHLAGPVAYGQLTLKRGMTANTDLWTWFDDVQQQPGLRADGDVVVVAPDRASSLVTFRLTNCMPVKLKGPALSGKDGQIAIEEMQLVYETLSRKAPSATSSGGR